MAHTTQLLTTKATDIAAAARKICAGQLVAFPTETVYGLGADACSGDAVAALYAAKGRPWFNPLIAHVPSLEAAARYGVFNDVALTLANAFWPGPLTLVVPLRSGSGLASLATAGLDTVALRVPAHPVAHALLVAADRPIAAPSANPSGRISPTTAAHVTAGLEGKPDAVIDGGPCQVGLESTIIDCSRNMPRLLRPGGLAEDIVEAQLTVRLLRGSGDADAVPTAPGQLASHYAPQKPVRLNAVARKAGELWLGFGPACSEADLSLSPTGDLAEAAARLFSALHTLDAREGTGIAVAPIPEEGLGAAINDRLIRAAAPRP